MAKTAEEIAADEVAEQQKKLDDEAAEQARLDALPDDDPEKIAAKEAATETGEEEDELDADGKPKAKTPAPADEEVTITIEGEASPASEEDEAKAPQWVKDLRVKNREDAKRIRELEAQLKAVNGAPIKPAELGPKPTLEDHEFDPDKYGAALEAWHERKRTHDEEARKQQDVEAQAKAAWEARLKAYNEAKAKLKVTGADEAEAMVKDIMSTTQQGIILSGAERPELVVVALGKNPKKAKELSAIKDPVKFAFAVARLELQLKVIAKKAPPPEETPPASSAAKAGAVDSQLERLRAEAAKTGDFTKVNQYKRDKRQAKRAA